MVNRKIWLGMLVMVLALGFMGCSGTPAQIITYDPSVAQDNLCQLFIGNGLSINGIMGQNYQTNTRTIVNIPLGNHVLTCNYSSGDFYANGLAYTAELSEPGRVYALLPLVKDGKVGIYQRDVGVADWLLPRDDELPTEPNYSVLSVKKGQNDNVAVYVFIDNKPAFIIVNPKEQRNIFLPNGEHTIYVTNGAGIQQGEGIPQGESIDIFDGDFTIFPPADSKRRGESVIIQADSNRLTCSVDFYIEGARIDIKESSL